MISGVGTTTTSSYLLELQQTTQSQSITALAAGTSTSTSSGAVSTVGSRGDTATISGPGKLFSELQQLQSSDPAKFKAVVSDIASKLQAAAQQSTGPQADVLSFLASKFQTAASTGDLSGLQPKHHHTHGLHTPPTYNSQGQPAAAGTSAPPPPPVGGTASTGGVDLKQLFVSISQEVSQAVGA